MYVVFSTRTTMVSNLIRYFESGSYWDTSIPTHVSLMFDDEWLIEAVHMGLTANWIEQFVKDNKVVGIYKFINVDDVILEFLAEKTRLEYIDYKYDFGALCGFLLILHKIKHGQMVDKNPYQSDKRVFCSEFVGEFIKAVEKKIDKHVFNEEFYPQTLGPNRLYKMVQASGYFEQNFDFKALTG